MTWYDGGPAPEPAPRRVRGRHVAAATRAELAQQAGGAAREDPEDDRGSWQPEAPRLRDAVRWRVVPRVAAAAVVVLALVGGAVALRVASAPRAPAVVLPEPSATAPLPAAGEPGARGSEAVESGAGVVWVHVVGRVAAPGLVELPAGSRVADAVAAAGGALPDADLAVVNLAAVVLDGAQVRVPAPGEQTGPAPADLAAGTEPGPAGAGGQVDVNAATAAELETLPGIGPVLAERIVAWRDEHGRFADVESLEDVPGIGPAVLAGLRDRARV